MVNRAASVSSSFPSAPRLDGFPLLRQGRRWLAGRCEVKQRPHLLFVAEATDTADEIIEDINAVIGPEDEDEDSGEEESEEEPEDESEEGSDEEE